MSDILSDSLEKKAVLEIGYENELGMFVIGLQQILGEHEFVRDFEQDQKKIYEDEVMPETVVLGQGKSFFQLAEKMENGEGQVTVDWRVVGNIILQFIDDLLEYKIHVYSLQLMEQTHAGALENVLPPPVRQGVVHRGKVAKITFSLDTNNFELGEGPINTPWWILIRYL